MKQLKKVLALGLCAALLTATLAGCSGGSEKAGEGDTIKIGVFEPLTGANAAGGQLEVEGMEIANKLHPEVLGKKIELVTADNKSDKAEAANAAARLIEKDKVSAVIGSWGSSLSMSAGDTFKSSKVPAVGASCTNPQVTLGNDYYFRVCYIDTFQSKIMANYAAKNLNAKKVAIVQEVSNDYSTGLSTLFKDEYTKLVNDPNAIVETVNYNTGDQDFNAILTTVKASNPDAIFAPGNYTESALLIKQAKALGITAPFIGCDTWETNEFITVGGKEVEGAVMSSFFDDKNPNLTPTAKEFVKAYHEAYPDRDNVPAFSALGYDAYMVIYNAIEKAGSADPQAIRDELAKTKDFEGVTGLITFDENGDALKSEAVIKSVKDGKFTYQDTVTLN
ncbi:MAG: ABC transporter substrate-binding protein [Eubacterium sp.]